MVHRFDATLAPGGAISRLIPLLALGALLTACHDAERSLAPRSGGRQFSLSATQAVNGKIAFHSTRDGDFQIYVMRSEEHTSELQSRLHLVCRLLLEKKKKTEILHSAASNASRTLPLKHERTMIRPLQLPPTDTLTQQIQHVTIVTALDSLPCPGMTR